jgi:hypothetical protein
MEEVAERNVDEGQPILSLKLPQFGTNDKKLVPMIHAIAHQI